MARMTIEQVRVAVADDGTVTIPDAEQMVVGQVMRDPESKQWVARVVDEKGKVGRAKTEHATGQAAFAAMLEARGIVKRS
jgi:endonuclease V-like protein UPF0215 family